MGLKWKALSYNPKCVRGESEENNRLSYLEGAQALGLPPFFPALIINFNQIAFVVKYKIQAKNKASTYFLYNQLYIRFMECKKCELIRYAKFDIMLNVGANQTIFV